MNAKDTVKARWAGSRMKLLIPATVGMSALLAFGPGGLPASAKTDSVTSNSTSVVRSKEYSLRLVKVPKKVIVGNSQSKNCRNRITVKISGSKQAGATYSLRYSTGVVRSSVSDNVRLISNIRVRKNYRLFPYDAPEFGPGYQVTFCGTLNPLLLPFTPGTIQRGVLNVELLMTVDGQTRRVASSKRNITINYNGFSG